MLSKSLSISLRIQLRKSFLSTGNKFNSPFLKKRNSNYTELSPISFLNRAGKLYADKPCYYHDNKGHVNWKEVHTRVQKFASVLVEKFSIEPMDVVSMICPNSIAAFELHFSVPGIRAVLHPINIRLDAKSISFQLQHAGTKLLVVDSEFIQVVQDALYLLPAETKRPILVKITSDEIVEIQNNGILHDYEKLVDIGDADYDLHLPQDEWDAMSLNYTSGTTGGPKGVVVHHRGMYLNSLANIVELGMFNFPKYLWIVPLFHCNGWCFAYSMAAIGGCSYFVRQVRANALFDIISQHKIQYLAGAPVIMNMMLAYEHKFKFQHDAIYMTAGAAPPPAIIERFKHEIGIQVRTAYGLTESYGPVSTSSTDIDSIDYNLIFNCATENITVYDQKTGLQVPPDGTALGQVVIRGNTVMKGYLNNAESTENAFEGGVFHTGDLGVLHPNNRVQIKDRSKDIIISGGENICSIEVENTLQRHKSIMEVAVVAQLDDHWGEVTCAFVKLAVGVERTTATEAELIAWSRSNMARFQAPKRFIFVEELPRTSTGKVQKHILRELIHTKNDRE